MKKRKPNRLTLREVADLFFEQVRNTKKDNTLKHYQGRLRGTLKILGKRPIEKLTLAEIEDALNKANKKPSGELWAPDTRRANITVLQTLFDFALRRGYLEEKPFGKLERPRGRPRQRIPTESENLAIEVLADPAFLLIFRALRQTGARPGELCSAEIDHWKRDDRLIVIPEHKTVGKTGRPREIGVGEKLTAMLLKAIGDRESGPIFLDKQGRPWKTATISAKYRELREKAGLPKDLCLYLQRHQHATIITEKLGIEAAALALGHASIQTTQRYNHPDRRRLATNQDVI